MSPLRDYEDKRDFRKTPEPSGEKGKARNGHRFVIQKHDARSLHYDLRLEVDGALKSWAVPKGPSTDPREKRLATMTEDHPLAYADFEGVIPEGEYGAGPVMIWDRGTYRNTTTDDQGDAIPFDQGLKKGHVSLWLEGEKLSGGYALTHTGRHSEKDWLLVKMDDDEADARRNPTSTQAESVVSDRSLEQIAEEESAGDERGDDS